MGENLRYVFSDVGIAILFCSLMLIIYLKQLKPYVALILLLTTGAGIYFVRTFQTEGYFALTGDGLFMTSFVTKVMWSKFFGDYFYHGKPIIYPPGYFWLAGTYGRILGLSSMLTLKTFSGIAIMFTGICSFLIGKAILNETYGLCMCFSTLFLIPHSFITDDFFFKPYTALAGILIPYWVFQLASLNPRDMKQQLKSYFVGLLIIFFHYPFLALFGIPAALVLFFLNRKKFFSKKLCLTYLIPIAVLLAIIFFAFCLPSSLSSEHETITTTLRASMVRMLYTDPSYFTPTFMTLNIGNKSSLFVLTVFSYLFFRKRYIMKRLFFIPVIAGYLFYFGNLLLAQITNKITIGLSYLPLFISAASIYPAAYFLSKGLLYLHRKFGKVPVAIMFLIVFLWGIYGKLGKLEWQEPYFRPLDRIALEITKRNYPKDSVMLLSEGTYLKAIPAVLPVYLYLSPSESYSHPTISYPKRMEYLAKLSVTRNPEEFYSLAIGSPYGSIVVWGLKKESPNEIRFIFHKPVPGGICNWQYYDRSVLEDRRYFDKVYEDEISVLYLIKLEKATETLKIARGQD